MILRHAFRQTRLLSNTAARWINRFMLCSALAFASPAQARADLPNRIERTGNEIRLKVTNAWAEPARCRFRLQLHPIDRTLKPVDVDIALVVPEHSRDFIAWRVFGNVADYRIAETWLLSCNRRR